MTEIPYRVGAPARRAFVAAGYTTLEELLAADEKDLLALHGVGPKAIRDLFTKKLNRSREGRQIRWRRTAAPQRLDA